MIYVGRSHYTFIINLELLTQKMVIATDKSSSLKIAIFVGGGRNIWKVVCECYSNSAGAIGLVMLLLDAMDY